MSALESLKQHSTIVADTGDLAAIKKYLPQDTTTNPSLILKTVEANPQYLDEVIREAKDNQVSGADEPMETFMVSLMVSLMVSIGWEILKIIPGRVSIEVPAHLSFSETETIKIAKEISRLFNQKGISNERILIKIAGTYPGIKAAAELEKNNIHCNVTLIFSLTQALAAAQNGITLISPFVGRVLDWYQNNEKTSYSIEDDPGVELVRNIFQTLKSHNFKTEIMAASFRKEEQIHALAGCDLLTIAPKFLESLSKNDKVVQKSLNKEKPSSPLFRATGGAISGEEFYWQLCQNQMASEKLLEGIRLFHSDYLKLKKILETRLSKSE